MHKASPRTRALLSSRGRVRGRPMASAAPAASASSDPVPGGRARTARPTSQSVASVSRAQAI
eukprot:2298833-Alexandrium_andersonii.AAC.1